MPTYDYVCEKCGASFELFQSMKDEALTVCPREKCARARWGKGRVHRQLGTGAGLLFKGSGFYITDYRSEGYRQAAKQEADSSKPKPAGGEKGGGDKSGGGKSPARKSGGDGAAAKAK